MATPQVSICVPIHKTLDPLYFWRLIQSIMRQTFKDYEIVITQEGLMARNTNASFLKARGKIIKLMQSDDFFAHNRSLEVIVEMFEKHKDKSWLMTGCWHTGDEQELVHPHLPRWNDQIYTGRNTLGGLSCLAFKRENMLLLEEPLTWVVDCDLYKRYYDLYGLPILCDDLNIVIQWGDHQVTNNLTDQEKQKEVDYLLKKYAK